MTQEDRILTEYPDTERGAYISAIASIATADRSASEDELEFLEALVEAADLSEEQKERVRNAATGTSEEDLRQSLDHLKNSELRYSLMTDLVAFAESDQNYSDAERAQVQQIAQYLNINGEQLSTINQFVQKASTSDVDAETMQKQGFLGMEDKFQKAGINMGSITKGLLGVAGPIILATLASRALGGRRSGGLGGMLGGLLGTSALGGMLGGGGGGLGGMLGGSGAGTGGGLGGMLGGGSGMGGGLGSIIGMLNGGRGIGSTGGLFGKIFGR